MIMDAHCTVPADNGRAAIHVTAPDEAPPAGYTRWPQAERGGTGHVWLRSDYVAMPDGYGITRLTRLNSAWYYGIQRPQLGVAATKPDLR